MQGRSYCRARGQPSNFGLLPPPTSAGNFNGDRVIEEKIRAIIGINILVTIHVNIKNCLRK